MYTELIYRRRVLISCLTSRSRSFTDGVGLPKYWSQYARRVVVAPPPPARTHAESKLLKQLHFLSRGALVVSGVHPGGVGNNCAILHWYKKEIRPFRGHFNPPTLLKTAP